MGDEPRWLEEVRVLDLSRLLPGPFCTMLLSDMGAEVLKVERPGGGDYAREFPPKVDGTAAFYAAVNRGKSSMTLDLKSDEGVELFRELVDEADVVVESNRPGVMKRLGVGAETLRDRNSELIYCTISGYGTDGPCAERVGHDLNYVARAGFLDQNASSGGEPVIPGAQIADVAGGGLYAALGVVGALYRRSRTGDGETIDISMTEGTLSLHAPLQAVTAAGDEPRPGDETLNGGIAAYNIYETADGEYLAVGALEPKFWMNLVQVVGCPELATEGHATGEAGREARETLADALSERTRDEWLERFEGEDVCVEPVQSPAEVARDELFRARKVFFEIAGVRQTRTPVTPRDLEPEPAPKLGEDTRDVLGRLGRSDERIDELEAEGVV